MREQRKKWVELVQYLLTDIKNLKIILKTMIAPNLKPLDQCTGPSPALRTLSPGKVTGGRGLLAPLWKVLFPEAPFGSGYSSIQLNLVWCSEVVSPSEE